jgi:hypothetical protein
LGKLHILQLEKTNTTFKQLLDVIYVLPFVPVVEVVNTFEEHVLGKIDAMKKVEEFPFGDAETENKVLMFINYLERTWIGVRVGLSSRGAGKYMIKEWNHFYDLLNGDDLTNNTCEGRE